MMARLQASSSVVNQGEPLTERLQALQRIIRRAGVQPFRVHDFRRTVDTGLAKLIVTRETRECVLNHSAGPKMDRVYNVHDYDNEKRGALLK